MSLKTPNTRLIRWEIKLEEYNFEIKYTKGNQNNVGDALSRIEINVREDEDSLPMVPQTSEDTPHTIKEKDKLLDDDLITVMLDTLHG